MPVLSSVSKALTLLGALPAEKPELTLTELARQAGAHKSSAFRLLSTLEAHGFVEKSPSGRGYRLGWKPLALSGRLHDRRRAQPGSRLGHGQGAAGRPAARGSAAPAGRPAAEALHPHHHHGPAPPGPRAGSPPAPVRG